MPPAADAPDGPDPGPDVPTISIPDVRDYQRINAELLQRLDAGHPRVRLSGAEGQRLLVAGLSGDWRAVVEVEGQAGPELAAGLNAPRLTVVCRGSAADGAGSGLLGGRVFLVGDAGPAVGYAQRGGTIVVHGAAGPRAGLNQSGGLLFLLGAVGPLAGERQSGGTWFANPELLGPHARRGQRGGRFLAIDPDRDADKIPSFLDTNAEGLAPF
ncbi:MAG: glutamate synthase [Planctomycetia bacterium]|nr:glutamate synthase [Planctomycetia bacterium]